MALWYSYLLKLQEQMARKEKASDIGKKWEKKKGSHMVLCYCTKTVAQPPDLLILRTLPNSDQLRI